MGNLSTLKSFSKLYSMPDPWLSKCQNASNIIEAIEMATNPNDKNPHQFRLPKGSLRMFGEKLIMVSDDLIKSKDYDEIYQIVKEIGEGIENIGVLAIYDVATRIGFFLKIKPDKVYLHAGTKIGAQFYLNDNLRGKKYLEMNELPSWLKNSGLEPYQIEVFLCVCKKGEYPYKKGGSC